jgi:hypothetical protein
MTNWLSVVSVSGLFYLVLVYLLMTVGMDERILGSAEWLPARFLICLCVAILGGISLAITGKRRTAPSTFFIVFQLIFVHIPSCALCAVHQTLPLWFIIMTGIILMLIGLFVRRLANSLNISYPVPLKILLAVPLMTWILYALSIYLLAILQGRFSLSSAFNMDVLYAFRAEVFSDFSGKALTALGALGYFFIPLLMIMAIKKKRQLIIFISVVSVIMLYGVTGMKAYLAVPVLTAVTFLMSQKFRIAGFFVAIAMMVTVMILSAGLLGYYLDSPWPLALFFSRGVMTPGELHLIYADYFADSARVPIWELIRTKMPDGGDLNWAELIHQNVFGGTVGQGEGQNTGMIASSFAVYGLLGVVLHSAFMVVILSILDRFSERQRMAWIPFAAIPSFFLLTNQDLVSNFIYYGLGFSLMLTICMTRKAQFRAINTIYKDLSSIT